MPVISSRGIASPGQSATRRWMRSGGPALVLLVLAGCGDGNGGSPAGSSTPPPVTTVTVTPAAQSISTDASLAVTVAVSGSAGGGVVLTSGSYTSAAATLTSGSATITVPAGVLAIGTDTLTATFQSTTGAMTNGSASVAVSAGTMPTVTATSTVLATAGSPFSALPTASGLLVSVSANQNGGSRTGLRVYTGAAPTALALECFQPVLVPNANGVSQAFGLAATPNGAGLALAVENPGLALLGRGAVENGCSASPSIVSQGSPASQQGSFDLAITPDGRYAFVANEYGVAANDASGNPIKGNVGVVALSYAANGVPTGGQLIGQIATGGQAIAGITLSPDGSRLYVTSEVSRTGTTVAGTGNAILAHGGCTQGGTATQTYGTLSVIDVAKAEAAPGSSAIVATIAAGCSPVRTVVTGDGNVLWLAARGDNRVLAFSTRALESSPDTALLGYANTGGVAPVGLTLFAGGRLLAVANSNRFASPAVTGSLTILRAVPVRPTLLQTVAAGYFPRNVSVGGDDRTLFLTNFGTGSGGSVQVISTASS